jgi:hypothetical protein
MFESAVGTGPPRALVVQYSMIDSGGSAGRKFTAKSLTPLVVYPIALALAVNEPPPAPREHCLAARVRRKFTFRHPRPAFAVTSSMPARTIAIGDVHGCAAALRSLLAEVRPEADDTIVMLGDCVDRGPDSRGVI